MFELYGSGRTDAGVHALAQVAHLDVDVASRPTRLRRRSQRRAAVRHRRPARSNRCRHRFHARHDAVARSYLYQIARRKTAFAKPFVWWVKEPLDLDADARRRRTRSSASTTSGRSPTTIPTRSRPRSLVDVLDIHEDEDLILIHVEGSHFIWKMVRRLVGVLVAIGAVT